MSGNLPALPGRGGVSPGGGGRRLRALTVVFVTVAVLGSVALMVASDLAARHGYLTTLRLEARRLAAFPQTASDAGRLRETSPAREALAVMHDFVDAHGALYGFLSPLVYGDAAASVSGETASLLAREVVRGLAYGVKERLASLAGEEPVALTVERASLVREEAALARFQARLQKAGGYVEGYRALLHGDFAAFNALVRRLWGVGLPERAWSHPSQKAALRASVAARPLELGEAFEAFGARSLSLLGALIRAHEREDRVLRLALRIKEQARSLQEGGGGKFLSLGALAADLRRLAALEAEGGRILQPLGRRASVRRYLHAAGISGFPGAESLEASARTLRAYEKGRLRALGAAATPLTGRLLERKGERWRLGGSAGRALALMEEFLQAPFLPEEQAFDESLLRRAALHAPAMLWDSARLSALTARAQSFMRRARVFAAEAPSPLRGVLHGVAAEAVTGFLVREAGGAWSIAQAAPPDGVATSASAARGLAAVLATLDDLAEGGAVEQSGRRALDWLVMSWAYRSLEVMRARLQASPPLTPPAGLASWDGTGRGLSLVFAGGADAGAALGVWLEGRFSRLRAALAEAAPLLSLLEHRRFRADLEGSALPDWWRALSGLAWEGVESAPILANFSLFRRLAATSRPCRSLFPFGGRGGHFAQEAQAHPLLVRDWRRFHDVFLKRCLELPDYQTAVTQYNEVVEAFNRDLAGRYPFAPLHAPDADPVRVRHFFAWFSRHGARLEEDFSSLSSSVSLRSRALAFLSALRAARGSFSVLSGYGESGAGTQGGGIAALRLGVDIGESLRVRGLGALHRLVFTSGEERVAWRHGRREALWRPGDGLAMRVVWRAPGDSAPRASGWYRSVSAALRRHETATTFAEHGPWALLRFLARYRKEAQDMPDAALVALPLRIPVPAGGGSVADEGLPREVGMEVRLRLHLRPWREGARSLFFLAAGLPRRAQPLHWEDGGVARIGGSRGD